MVGSGIILGFGGCVEVSLLIVVSMEFEFVVFGNI